MSKFGFMPNGDVIIEDARLLFKNFAGAKTRFNDAGKRNFNIVIDDPEVVQQMLDMGYNVRILGKREDDDEVTNVVKVNVNFDSKWPPRVYEVVDNKKIPLDGESVGILDDAYLTNVDIVCSTYRSGMGQFENRATLYLRELYASVDGGNNYFSDKYRD